MLEQYNIILGSGSPRRKELLAGLDLHFQVLVRKGVSEDYPDNLSPHEVAQYIAEEKMTAYTDLLIGNTLVITADTVVICDNDILGKPKDADDARRMLEMLSGKTHQVTTGVCIATAKQKTSFHVTTDVTFKNLTPEEISFYIKKYKPFDKAGAYGIQEWIGYIGVTALNGSYFNVMGLPVQRIYDILSKLKD